MTFGSEGVICAKKELSYTVLELNNDTWTSEVEY